MFVPLTPLRCLHRAADLYGSRIGVVSEGRQFTYAELVNRVERLATGLRKAGIAPGDRVAYLSFNNHQLLEGYFGVIQARAIVMPLNVRLEERKKKEEIERKNREEAERKKQLEEERKRLV